MINNIDDNTDNIIENIIENIDEIDTINTTEIIENTVDNTGNIIENIIENIDEIDTINTTEIIENIDEFDTINTTEIIENIDEFDTINTTEIIENIIENIDDNTDNIIENIIENTHDNTDNIDTTDNIYKIDNIYNIRLNLNNIINLEKNILEIGASHSPLIEHNRPNIYNIDVMTKQELIDKNIKENWGYFDESKIPETDFLLNKENDFDFFKCIGNTIKFDYILSSHNFEHFPNFIKSLNSLSNVLEKSGKIIAFIPDCRFVFDKYRNITKITKILSDYYHNKTKPSFEEILENRLYYCNESQISLWEKYDTYNNNDFIKVTEIIQNEENNLLNNSINKGNDKNEIDYLYSLSNDDLYVDAHVNTFTPESFQLNIDILFKLGYINLKIDKIYETPKNSHEFVVIMSKND